MLWNNILKFNFPTDLPELQIHTPLLQVPLPLQSCGHVGILQYSPVYPFLHWHALFNPLPTQVPFGPQFLLHGWILQCSPV